MDVGSGSVSHGSWQKIRRSNSFQPETDLFPNLSVNLRIFLCGVKHYACAEKLDFLDLVKNFSLPI